MKDLKTNNFPDLLKTIGKLPDDAKFKALFKASKYFKLFNNRLIVESKGNELLEKNISVFLEAIEILPDKDQYRAFFVLIGVAKEKGWIEEHFPVFLETIVKLPYCENFSSYNDYRAFYMAMNSEVVNKFYSQIDTHILALLNSIKKFTGFTKYWAMGDFYRSIRNTELLNKYYSQFETCFLDLLNNIDKLDYMYMVDQNTYLCKVAKEMGWIKEHIPTFLKIINNLRGHDRYSAFSALLKVAKEIGCIGEYLPDFLKTIDQLYGIRKFSVYLDHKYVAFSELITAIKNTKLLSEHSSRIKTLFLALIDGYDKLSAYNKQIAYSYLIEEIKDTDLENESAYKKWKQENSFRRNNYSLGILSKNYQDFENLRKKRGKERLESKIND